jgi:hypothetical protein
MNGHLKRVQWLAALEHQSRKEPDLMLSGYPIATRPGSLTARQGRTIGRHFDALQVGTSLELAEIRAAEAVEIAKIGAIRGTSNAALSAVASVAAHRRVHAEADPTALAYLTHVAEKSAMALGDQVERASQRLG